LTDATDGRVETLASVPFTVGVHQSVFDAADDIVSIDISFGGQQQAFAFDPVHGWYSVSVLSSAVGLGQAMVTVRYGSGTAESVFFTVESQGYGRIVDSETGNVLEHVSVRLYQDSGDTLWDGGAYR